MVIRQGTDQFRFDHAKRGNHDSDGAGNSQNANPGDLDVSPHLAVRRTEIE
jgi:hypothetical protein